MKSLYELVLENTTKFDNYVSNFNELVSTCDTLRACSNKELLKQFFDDVVNSANYRPDELFIYALGAQYFKVPYAFNNYIMQLINSKYSNDLKYTTSGKKIKVFFKNQKGELFETGSGSIGRVSTAHQEEATCIVWNAYIDAVSNNIDFNLRDHTFIKNLVSDLTSNFDKEWILTFTKQVMCISDYLNKLGLDPVKYKLCRYGSKEGIGSAYKKYIDSYTKEIGGKKDNFDPSDVILYKVDEISKINQSLNSYCANPIENKIKYIEELFNKHLLKGLSLKKISGTKDAQYDIYNTGSANKVEKVSSFNIKIRRDTNLTVLCKGIFNFDNITDGDGEELNNQKRVELVMRSFGANQVGIDCTLRETKKTKSPTLGKCPARIWREILKCDESDDLVQCVAKFKEFLNNKNCIIGLEKIIKGSIKEGPLCFPFVLIH